jgi:hypothetical protein
MRKALILTPANASEEKQHDRLGPVIAARLRAELEQRGVDVRQAVGAGPMLVWGDTARELADRARSSVVVSGHYFVRRDSLIVRLYVVERLRNFIPRSYTSRPVPISDPLAALESILPSAAVRVEAALAKKKCVSGTC